MRTTLLMTVSLLAATGCAGDLPDSSAEARPGQASPPSEAYAVRMIVDSIATSAEHASFGSALTQEIPCGVSGRMIIDVVPGKADVSLEYDDCSFDGDLSIDGTTSMTGDAESGTMNVELEYRDESIGGEMSFVGTTSYSSDGDDFTITLEDYSFAFDGLGVTSAGTLSVHDDGTVSGIFGAEFSHGLTVSCTFDRFAGNEAEALAACNL